MRSMVEGAAKGSGVQPPLDRYAGRSLDRISLNPPHPRHRDFVQHQLGQRPDQRVHPVR